MYGFVKDLKFKLGWYLLTKAHPLKYLFLEITRKCNLKCLYCGSDCVDKFQTPELTTNQWLDAIKQIANDFTPPNIMVGITGGEAFLRKDIFDMMALLRNLKFRYGVITNGTLIDSYIAKELVKLKINTVTLSLDGPKTVNDSLRGPTSFTGVENAVSSLKQAGFKGKLEIFSSITKPTLDTLAKMQELLKEWKINHWRMGPVFLLGRAKSNSQLILDNEGLVKLLDFIYEARIKRRFPIPLMCEEGALPIRYEAKVRPYVSQCRSGITIGSVLCDGSIAACPELGKEFIQGNILKDRFSDIWKNKYQIFRDRNWLKDKGLCKDCQHFSRCQGSSLHLYDPSIQSTTRCYWQLN